MIGRRKARKDPVTSELIDPQLGDPLDVTPRDPQPRSRWGWGRPEKREPKMCSVCGVSITSEATTCRTHNHYRAYQIAVAQPWVER